MNVKINIGDKFECIRRGETEWSVFEIKEARDDRYMVQWPDGKGSWGIETLLTAIDDGVVRRANTGPSAAQPAAVASPSTRASSLEDIKVGDKFEHLHLNGKWLAFKVTDEKNLLYEISWYDGTADLWSRDGLSRSLVSGHVRRVDPSPSASQPTAVASQPARSGAIEEIKFGVGQVYAWGEEPESSHANTFKITAIDTTGWLWTERISGKPVESPITHGTARSLVETNWWRLIGHGPSGSAAQTSTQIATTQPTTSVATITQTAIRSALPADLRELPIMDAIRQLTQVYVARKYDSDSATTVQELRALVDRMRQERIAGVSSRKEIMSDNEYFDPSP